MIPLKVTVGLTEMNRALYPDFQSVLKDMGIRVDWCHWVDQFGGWHYDHVGHQEDDSAVGSPVGVQLAMLIVPEEFAIRCVEAFPDKCEALAESDCEVFYNSRAHRDDPENIEDLNELQTLVALEQLGVDVAERKRAALDPLNTCRGCRVNPRKTWSQFKSMRGITVEDARVRDVSERRRQALEARRQGNGPD